VIRLSPILDTGWVKIGNQDPEAYRQRLEAKLRPDRIRATLGFAGLYQMIHELIKTAVPDEMREFYWRGIEDGVVVYDEQDYAENVLRRNGAGWGSRQPAPPGRLALARPATVGNAPDHRTSPTSLRAAYSPVPTPCPDGTDGHATASRRHTADGPPPTTATPQTAARPDQGSPVSTP
jgi:hypothetical protein